MKPIYLITNEITYAYMILYVSRIMKLNIRLTVLNWICEKTFLIQPLNGFGILKLLSNKLLIVCDFIIHHFSHSKIYEDQYQKLSIPFPKNMHTHWLFCMYLHNFYFILFLNQRCLCHVCLRKLPTPRLNNSSIFL